MRDARAGGNGGAGSLLPGPGEIWGAAVADIPTDRLVGAVAKTVRELLLPDYAASRPTDRRPERALEAAETWLSRRTGDARAHAAAVAKACTAARRETLGFEHRIAEAARAVATAVTRTDERATRAELFEALARTEDHLLHRHAVKGVHDTATEVRACILETLRGHAGA